MTDVWIYHEVLDRYSLVPETAVGVHAMSGWVQQDPPVEQEAYPEGVTAAEVLAELETLKAQAEELGLKVDGRWGAERLRAEIEAAQPTQEGDKE